MNKLIVILSALTFTSFAYGHGNQAHSTLGNENNINNCNPTLKCPKAKVIYKNKVVTKVVEKPVVKEVVRTIKVEAKARKNSLSLFAGSSQTDLEDHKSGANTVVETDAELDLGIMYQRDLSEKTRLSILGTMNKTILLGLGVNF